jgi:hypothetical protein
VHFYGTIFEGERVVAFEVEGDYRVSTRRGGEQHWEGNLSVPRDAAVHDGGTYTLRLDDGREGEILVGGGPYTVAGAHSFAFKGNGLPPVARLD